MVKKDAADQAVPFQNFDDQILAILF